MRSLLFAFQFLTIIPVRIGGTFRNDALAASTVWYVLVGAVQGFALLATDYTMGNLFHPDIVPALILAVLIASTGAFHLDGLADTADALSMKSSGSADKDRERRLAIMKDPAAGPAGVTVIFLVLLLKYLCIRSCANLLPFTYSSALVLMPAFAKWSMVAAMAHGRPARPDGLGRIFLERVTMRHFILATLSGCVLITVLVFKWGRFGDIDPILFYPSVGAGVYALTLIWVRFCSSRFGGMTGDTLGALNEIIELIFLMAVLAWSRLSISFATA